MDHASFSIVTFVLLDNRRNARNSWAKITKTTVLSQSGEPAKLPLMSKVSKVICRCLAPIVRNVAKPCGVRRRKIRKTSAQNPQIWCFGVCRPRGKGA